MKGYLEIREFDKIVRNKEYAYCENAKYMPEKMFKELVDFIHTFTEEDDADILDFLKIGFQRNIGEFIQAKNYVGIIQMANGYQLQILPKISFDREDTENVNTKRVLIKMLSSMKDFPCKLFNESNLNMDRMNLYEIFINMYIREVRELIKKGLRSAYLLKEDNKNFYKGKLLINQQIKNNLVHKERFYVCYDEYQVNRAENKLIKATLLKLLKISTSLENVKSIVQLLPSFGLVEESTNYQKDLQKIVIDRNGEIYKNLVSWSKVFLMNQSFLTFTGTTTARALLFPMERVFEAYVAKNLKKAINEIGWEISTQDKGYYLFDFPKNQFALRPDILITRADGNRIILDTKWKRLKNKARRNYGISQGDMYQMYAYSKKYKISDIWLLYPAEKEMEDVPRIEFKSEDHVRVRIFFVELACIETSMQKLIQELK